MGSSFLVERASGLVIEMGRSMRNSLSRGGFWKEGGEARKRTSLLFLCV